MKEFKVHDLASAPVKSRNLLERAQSEIGMIPNLYGVMAESPEVLEAYQTLSRLFQLSSFNEEEMTVVWQTINVEHGCHYCVPAHAAIAAMMKVDNGITEALRSGKPLENSKLQVLRETVLKLVVNRGVLPDEDAEKFYEAGYNRKNLLELVLGVAQKVMSNYINHLADTPLDPPFKKFS